jgi:hypothetical protein
MNSSDVILLRVDVAKEDMRLEVSYKELYLLPPTQQLHNVIESQWLYVSV